MKKNIYKFATKIKSSFQSNNFTSWQTHENKVNTNTNSLEFRIRVEAFNAKGFITFLTEMQGFPVAWLVLTTSLLVTFGYKRLFCDRPHFVSSVTNGVCSRTFCNWWTLEIWNSNISFEFQQTSFLSFSPCFGLYIVDALTTCRYVHNSCKQLSIQSSPLVVQPLGPPKSDAVTGMTL